MKRLYKITIAVVVLMILIFTMSSQTLAATTTNIYANQLSITDSTGTGSGDATQYTITVKGGRTSAKTNTITIRNEGATDAVITFGYSVSNQSGFTIAGASVSTTGDHSALVTSGGVIEIKLTAAKNLIAPPTATLNLTNITYSVAVASSEITYEYDSSLGSVTADGIVVGNGSAITVTDSEVQVVATPVSGAKFVGWVDKDNKIISKNSAYSQKSVGDSIITALFSKDTPYFMVDNTYIFSDLNKAAGKGTNIVLVCDGILPAGDYEIPAKKTLLIPFDDANTMYTTEPEGVNGYTKPSVYRTLTLANGTNITVNGSISVSAKQASNQGNTASPTGAYGHIAMEDGSTITVNSGGNLYAWGYITGSGKITAKSSATVYENFQVRDWRGGDATSKMIDNANRVFPMSQYYVQNIEVPLTLEADAVENGYMSVFVTALGIQYSEVPFIGPNGMFRITSGSITKDYDEQTDRLIIDVDGTLEMGSLSISMNLGMLIGTKKMNSSNYTLPINGNITLNINSGSQVNVSQDMALLPGGVINVYKDAKCIFASGAKAFIYDNEDWGKYCSHNNNKLMPANYVSESWYDRYNRTEADLVDAEVYVEGEVDAYEGFVYTTAAGANVYGAEGGLVKIKSDIGTTETYQATQNSTTISYAAIPVTTANLKNSDGTYIDPEVLADCCSTYVISAEGKWTPQNPSHTEVAVPAVEPTCTEAGKTEGSYCSVCNTVIKEQETVDALGHSYGKWTNVDETNHSKTCACGDVVTEAHGWDSGVVTTPETCKETGIKTFTCAGCGATRTEEIPVDADNHTFIGFSCSVCGYKKVVTETTYTISDGDITISTDLVSDVSDDSWITIATFDSMGRLLNIVQGTAATLKEASMSSVGVDVLNVYVWDGVKVMTPISGVESIEL